MPPPVIGGTGTAAPPVIGTVGGFTPPTIGGTGVPVITNPGANFERKPPGSRVDPNTDMKGPAPKGDAFEDRQREAQEVLTGQQVEDLTAGGAEVRQDFARPTGGNAPSNFVSFGDFAGLNDDMLREIADRAAAQSETKRQDAAGFLAAAKGEATATTPLEKTASYAKYLEAVQSARQTAAGATAEGAKSATGVSENPYEDALRGIYRGAQNARENRLQTNALKRGANAAKLSNAEYAAAAKAAADAEAARLQAIKDAEAARAAKAKGVVDRRVGADDRAARVREQQERTGRVATTENEFSDRRGAGRPINRYGD